MIVDVPDYTEVLAEYHPDTEFVSTPSTGSELYTDITFTANPISQAMLDQCILDRTKERAVQITREQVAEARDHVTSEYLGTSTPDQLRTYDEKYQEALQLIADPNYPAVQIQSEAAETGEDPVALAYLVKMQYEYVKAQLRPYYGEIEGKRRARLAAIAAAPDIATILALPEVEWVHIHEE